MKNYYELAPYILHIFGENSHMWPANLHHVNINSTIPILTRDLNGGVVVHGVKLMKELHFKFF